MGVREVSRVRIADKRRMTLPGSLQAVRPGRAIRLLLCCEHGHGRLTGADLHQKLRGASLVAALGFQGPFHRLPHHPVPAGRAPEIASRSLRHFFSSLQRKKPRAFPRAAFPPSTGDPPNLFITVCIVVAPLSSVNRITTTVSSSVRSARAAPPAVHRPLLRSEYRRADRRSPGSDRRLRRASRPSASSCTR